MKNLKKESGITVLAVIVTIMLMSLIFATVLEELIGNSGFISQMRSKKEQEELSQQFGKSRIEAIKEQAVTADESIEISDADPEEDIIYLQAKKTNASDYKSDIVATVKVEEIYNKEIERIGYSIKKQSDVNFSDERFDMNNPVSFEHTFNYMDVDNSYDILVNVYFKNVAEPTAITTSIDI